MKRMSRRLIAVMLGLALGWYSAALLRVETASFASGEHAGAAADAHGTAADHGADGAGHAAEALVPQGDRIPWLGAVRNGVIALFVAAVVIGIPVMKLKGPEPPDPDR